MSDELRKYMNITEGKSLPMRRRSISIPIETYELVRFLMKLGAGANYNDAMSLDEKCVFTFYTDNEMKDTIALLDKLGIGYKNISCNDLKKNGECKSVNAVSPVATNPWAKTTKPKSEK